MIFTDKCSSYLLKFYNNSEDFYKIYTNAAVLEMMIEKGFKEGFTMTLDNLEKLLTSLS